MAGQQTDTDSVKAQAESREDMEASRTRTRTSSSKGDDVGPGIERIEITEEDVGALILLRITSASIR